VSWQREALCRDADPRWFFSESPHDYYDEAREYCLRCPVTAECLATGIVGERRGWRHGMWGGLSPQERDDKRLMVAVCPECESQFAPRPWERFCSDGCRLEARRRTRVQTNARHYEKAKGQ
jgi:hypothetical protein